MSKQIVKLRIRAYLVGALLLFGFTLVASNVRPSYVSALPAQPAGKVWSVAFSDDFSGSSLDTSVWQPYYNTYGSGNNELECNTPNNVSVSGGTLKITAQRETVSCNGGGTRNFTSGFLGTRETGHYFTRYGYYEMRAKLPHGQGLWPAFWLRHKNGASTAEVDIMEYFHSQVPGKTTSTLHLDGRTNLSKQTVAFEAPTTAPAWHTWGVNIEPSGNNVTFDFYLDGSLFHSYTDTQHLWANSTDNNLFDIAINMAVGGNWAGQPDDALGYLRDVNQCAQGGTPPNNCISTGILRASFPATYEVDYVHVYQLQDTQPTPAPPSTPPSTPGSTTGSPGSTANKTSSAAGTAAAGGQNSPSSQATTPSGATSSPDKTQNAPAPVQVIRNVSNLFSNNPAERSAALKTVLPLTISLPLLGLIGYFAYRKHFFALCKHFAGARFRH